jgi:hypothetical protein
MRHLQLSIPTLNDEDRVFCAGHCFNLVVKAMLFVKPRSLKKTSLALAIPKPFNSVDAGALSGRLIISSSTLAVVIKDGRPSHELVWPLRPAIMRKTLRRTKTPYSTTVRIQDGGGL